MTSLKKIAESKGKEKVDPKKPPSKPTSKVPSRVPTPKVPSRPTTPLSRENKSFLNEKLLDPMRKPVAKRVAAPMDSAKEAIKLQEARAGKIKTLTMYYDKFPHVAPSKANQTKFFETADLAALDVELKRCQGAVSGEFTETICKELILDGMGLMDMFVQKYGQLFAANAPQLQVTLAAWSGTACPTPAQFFRNNPQELEVEIAEIAILWDDWLRRGPYVRLLVKYIRYVWHAAAMNAMLRPRPQPQQQQAPDESTSQPQPDKRVHYEDM